ncbi:glycosyltransferase family 4 protein [Hymenobacter endophyticus]|uniref:Glycosyltransferase family 4 protein n=1 Tax=Hymenobacter endophyticus TaxID=3076335 RepID=A0ABU3TCR6_9BACT|nr:glycosyltransferase family 4 protein [Hymenobacter endophyticus]MDU0369161.1 glycosyltransferase family 4 protein [Hymenobacter endophyticus]
MKILLSAYGCQPASGGENGNGFNCLWETAALGHEVWCFTTPLNKGDSLDSHLQKLAHEPAAQRITIVYVAVPALLTYLYRWQFGVYLHYIFWQFRAWRKARQLDAVVDFDMVHHITYNSLQMASWMWRLGKPLLLGPLGGGIHAPASLRSYLPDWFKTETLRNVISWLLINFDPNVRQSLRHATLVLAANRETADLARQLGATRVELAMSTGQPLSFYPEAYTPREPAPNGELRILWLARLFPRKGLHLVLDALGRVHPRVKFHLDIMGDGPVAPYLPEWIAAAGLEGRVTWHGAVSYARAREAYQEHDLFMLCSLRDTYAAQYIESMAMGLPILTLDHHGATDFIPAEAGRKVPVGTPAATAEALAREVEHLYDHPAELERMGRASFAYARAHNWPALVAHHLGRMAAASSALHDLATPPAVVATAELFPVA